MKLLIVESPSKAKTIGKYLGSEYSVVASIGHVRDLPKSNKKAVDIEHGFKPFYVISPGKEKVISEISSLAKKASIVYLATDPDREGEAISWHIVEAAKLAPSKTKRIVFHEITKEAVEEAIKHPRDIDDNLRKAQEARRVLDRLVGYDLSGLIWKKVRYGLSAGRVQSPALRILCEREREIQAFIPVPYWVIEAHTETLVGNKTSPKTGITFTAEDTIPTEAGANKIVEGLKKSKWSVGSVEETEVNRQPKAPFTTSTLQQAASTRLGYSPSRTMMIAQKLYEAGYITYMRTDSTTISEQATSAIATLINKMYGAKYSEPKKFATKSKNAQEAHEAVRPTKADRLTAGLTDDAKNLYKLIWQRTIASQMVSSVQKRTKIVAKISGAVQSEYKDVPKFSINGSRTVFDGWLKADPEAKGEDVELPQVSVGEELKLIDVIGTEKKTEPPSRYTEAGLIKELEKRGIGRPSTYASIIKTIEAREYVEKIGRSLKPTDVGDVVSRFLEDNFNTYISDTFTASMEDTLDDIANGTKEYKKTLTEFYGPFSDEVKAKEHSAKVTTLGDADPKFKCPVCGTGNMIIKLGRGGKFLSCSRYPECEGALTIDGQEVKKDVPVGIDPATNLPIFTKIGRFGPYVQLGEKTKENKKPRMASIPKEIDPSNITLEQALKFLSLPRTLGVHPDTGKEIKANNGRFGPYVVHDGDFRSIKNENVYEITLERALEILKEPKKVGFRGRRGKKAEAKVESKTETKAENN